MEAINKTKEAAHMEYICECGAEFDTPHTEWSTGRYEECFTFCPYCKSDNFKAQEEDEDEEE